MAVDVKTRYLFLLLLCLDNLYLIYRLYHDENQQNFMFWRQTAFCRDRFSIREVTPSRVYISKHFPQSNYPIMALAGASWWIGTKPTLIYQGNFKRWPRWHREPPWLQSDPCEACNRLAVMCVNSHKGQDAAEIPRLMRSGTYSLPKTETKSLRISGRFCTSVIHLSAVHLDNNLTLKSGSFCQELHFRAAVRVVGISQLINKSLFKDTCQKSMISGLKDDTFLV